MHHSHQILLLTTKQKSEVHDERYAEREEKNKYLIDVYFHGIECTDIPALIFMGE